MKRACPLLCLLLAGCLGENTENPVPRQTLTEMETKEAKSRPKHNEAEIEEFGFRLYWDSYIRDETITSVTMEGDQLYAFTANHRLYQIDLLSGMVNWVFDVGKPMSFTTSGRPITEFLYKANAKGLKEYDEIFFIAKDTLFALDKKNGSELFRTVLPFTASSAPQAGPTHVYMGSWDDRVYAVKKSRPLVPDWSWRTMSDVTARPAYEHPTLFVSSQDGEMHAFDGLSGKVKGPYRTDQKLRHDPLIYLSLIYLPSDDHNLYVIGAVDGILHYKFCAQAPINTHPVAISKSIYFGAEGKGMFALYKKGRPPKSKGNPNKTDFELLWQRKEARQLLCRGQEDVYVREPGEDSISTNLTRLDAKKGTFKDTLSVKDVDYFVTNANDPEDFLDKDRALRGGIIVMAHKNGWIFGLKEIATIPGEAPRWRRQEERAREKKAAAAGKSKTK